MMQGRDALLSENQFFCCYHCVFSLFGRFPFWKRFFFCWQLGKVFRQAFLKKAVTVIFLVSVNCLLKQQKQACLGDKLTASHHFHSPKLMSAKCRQYRQQLVAAQKHKSIRPAVCLSFVKHDWQSG